MGALQTKMKFRILYQNTMITMQFTYQFYIVTVSPFNHSRASKKRQMPSDKNHFSQLHVYHFSNHRKESHYSMVISKIYVVLSEANEI